MTILIRTLLGLAVATATAGPGAAETPTCAMIGAEGPSCLPLKGCLSDGTRFAGFNVVELANTGGVAISLQNGVRCLGRYQWGALGVGGVEGECQAEGGEPFRFFGSIRVADPDTGVVDATGEIRDFEGEPLGGFDARVAIGESGQADALAYPCEEGVS